MHIIFIDFDVSKQDLYKNVLKDIAPGNDLLFFNHPVQLIDHFKNAIIPYQIHVDVIICDIHFPSYTFSDLINFLRSSEETYSSHNFKISSIPIIIHTEYFDSDEALRLPVELITAKPINENNTSLSRQITGVVKSWREKIYDDLELLGVGLDFNFEKTNIGYAVRVKSQDTKILSKSFLIKQQRLPYQWLSKDFFELEGSIEELEKLVNQYMDLPRMKLNRERWEARLQEFFEKNPKFIFRDNYLKYWSQPKLNIAHTNKSYKPDFVKQPAVSEELSKNWDVIDLKLPIQEFMQTTPFHKTFTSKFFKSLKQIKDYKHYFMDEANKKNIEEVLSFHPKYPKLTLVVGRRNMLLEKQDLVYQELNNFNLADIYLLTYDEIIELQKKHLQTLLTTRV